MVQPFLLEDNLSVLIFAMQLKITPSFIFTFVLLLLVMMELHELVHITIGRIVCGCWGPRDFNVWSLCEGCRRNQPLWWLATFAGPLFSFAMMWIGRSMLSWTDVRMKAVGFSLIFANIPLGRITTVMMGGGDEGVVARHLMGLTFTSQEVVSVCSIVVMMLAVPPVIKACRVITNKTRSWLYIIGFLTLPLLFLLIYLLTLLNGLLNAGFLAQPWIMGTPLLITMHTVIALAALVVFRNKLISIQ